MLDPTTKRKFGLEHVKTENQATALANRLLNHQPPLFIPVERLKVRPRRPLVVVCVSAPRPTARTRSRTYPHAPSAYFPRTPRAGQGRGPPHAAARGPEGAPLRAFLQPRRGRVRFEGRNGDRCHGGVHLKCCHTAPPACAAATPVCTRPCLLRRRPTRRRYAWVYEGNATWNKLKLAGLVVAVIAACCYPLWPMVARTIVWYLSVTLLLALLGVTLLQFVVFGFVLARQRRFGRGREPQRCLWSGWRACTRF